MRHRAGQAAKPPRQTTGVWATDQIELAALGSGREGIGESLR